MAATGTLRAGGCDQCTKRGQDELPHVRGQGQQPRMPGGNGTRTAKRSYPTLEVRGGSWEEPPSIQGRGGSREEQPHVKGAVAVQAQEGLEDPSHVEGQEGQQ